MKETNADMRLVTDPEHIISAVETIGLAYIHSSGCAVLKDGTWLQPEQWNQWLAHLEIVEGDTQ